MPEVLTLTEAKSHLRITHDHEDADLNDKLLAATQVVIDYLTRRDTGDGATWNAAMAAWTTDTVPASVKAAMLVQFGELTRTRGDDQAQEFQRPTSLSPTVMALLMRYRDPGVA